MMFKKYKIVVFSFLFFYHLSLSSYTLNEQIFFNTHPINDSTLYLSDSVKMNGYLYSFISKESKDYNPKVFKYFIKGDQVNNINNIAADIFKKDNFIILSFYDLNKLEEKISNPDILSRFKNSKFENLLSKKNQKVFKSGDKLYQFSYSGKYLISFIDVNIVKSIIWLPKKMKLPQSGYIRVLILH